MRKGQVSVEYTVLLGLFLFVLLGVIIFAYSQYKNLENEIYVLEGQTAAQKICASIDHISRFDKGTVQHIEVYLPPNYNPEKSFLKDNVINLRVADSDLNCVSQIPIDGQPPSSYGKTRLILERTDRGVVIR
ncbi:hypothetical protein KO465_00645 [Candidatus Micrarchaeota archaeon]|jgi:hypothetical protein|nr:hypothetical protein [Candidatus Micrarchaeota archaeon]